MRQRRLLSQMCAQVLLVCQALARMTSAASKHVHACRRSCRGLGAQWDFIESLNGGSFLAGGTSTERHSPPESTGERRAVDNIWSCSQDLAFIEMSVWQVRMSTAT